MADRLSGKSAGITALDSNRGLHASVHAHVLVTLSLLRVSASCLRRRMRLLLWSTSVRAATLM
jgi:hypothetical protein